MQVLSSHAPRLRTALILGLLSLFLILSIATALQLARRQIANVPLGPQQSVHTVNPKMGMHTRLTDEVEPWKIKRTLEMVRELGAPFVVEFFPWAYIEEQPGRYNWVHADQVVDHAARQG